MTVLFACLIYCILHDVFQSPALQVTSLDEKTLKVSIEPSFKIKSLK